jgi:hypothetical protein
VERLCRRAQVVAWSLMGKAQTDSRTGQWGYSEVTEAPGVLQAAAVAELNHGACRLFVFRQASQGYPPSFLSLANDININVNSHRPDVGPCMD